MAIFILFTLAGHSQDKVITLYGDTIPCRILEFNGIVLTYSLSSNDSVCYKTNSKIYQLLYSDGQIQNVSQRISISGENDWKKVLITSDTADVEGLVKVGDLKAKTYSYSGDEEKAINDGEIKLKKEAAGMGAFMILITYRNSRGMYTPIFVRYNNAKSVFKAIAFTYKR
jgi:hypothetical protein